MTVPNPYSFTRYLAAKKTVDDRALNHRVWQSLSAALPPFPPGTPLRLLEIGAGIGTMLERMLAWDLLSNAEYTGIGCVIGRKNMAIMYRRRQTA